jgi:hypothetical protein
MLRRKVSDHRGTKGANLIKVESETTRQCVRQSSRVTGSPRPPRLGAAGDGQAERLRGFEVDDELELGVLLPAQGDRILIPCNDVDWQLESDLITGS